MCSLYNIYPPIQYQQATRESRLDKARYRKIHRTSIRSGICNYIGAQWPTDTAQKTCSRECYPISGMKKCLLLFFGLRLLDRRKLIFTHFGFYPYKVSSILIIQILQNKDSWLLIDIAPLEGLL